MLKWAVSSKRPGEPQQAGRLSLDSGGITKPKVSRRRSIGGPSCRRKSQLQARRILNDKENLHYMAGSTPGFPPKDLLTALRKFDINSPLKDVSNITPKSHTPGSARNIIIRSTPKALAFNIYQSNEENETNDNSSPILSTPISKKVNSPEQIIKRRRIILESPEKIFKEDQSSDNDTKQMSLSSHTLECKSEECVNNNSESILVCKDQKLSIEKSILSSESRSLIHGATLPTVEIEYSPCKKNDESISLSTLPVIGSRVFIKNPLYFTAEQVSCDDNKLSKKQNLMPFTENFSMLLNKLSPMSALRFNGHRRSKLCSEVSPLAKRLASLCFNRANTASPEEKNVERRGRYMGLRDDEVSIEMETKLISQKSVAFKEDSTASDSKMGDETLEKMIEDILKSTKKVKHARRVKLKTRSFETDNIVKPPVRRSLSEERAVVKPEEPCERLDLPDGDKTFIMYDSLNSSEREVRTPENRLSATKDNETVLPKNRKRCSSECTPLHNNSLPRDCDFNLKRQRCVRRKRSTLRDEGVHVEMKSVERESGLTLKAGIPSPFTPDNKNPPIHMLQSDSFNSITSHPFYLDNKGGDLLLCQSSYPRLGIPTSGVSNSSIMLGQYSSEKKRSMFGLTLECGIPSPASMFCNNLGLDSGFCMSSPMSNVHDDSDGQRMGNDSIDVISEPVTPVAEFRSSRRCLTYSPDYGNYSDEKRKSRKNQHHQSNAEVELTMHFKDDLIKVHIVRCSNLQRHNGSTKHINAYVKVCVNGVGIYQRTPVRKDSSEPFFGHTMSFPISNVTEKKLQVSVWHRDRQKRRSEFLGCISLSLSHAAKRELAGSWSLHTQARPPRLRRDSPPLNAAGMATESLSRDGDEYSKDINETGSSGRLATQQREADEHLFLKYLELDPIEGPDAGPAAVQRKASGNKAGRTPFTTTRRLVRSSDQGFGFSVVWTRPPRVERVEAGRAAERAGLLPGDYIVFVDRHNVVTMPESQVLTLIKSSGTQLLLETFRRSSGGHMAMSHARGSIASHVTISEAPCSPRTLPLTAAPSQRSRRPVALPHLAFTRESVTGGGSGVGVVTSSCGEHIRALHAVVLREQQYSAWMQFGMERYVVPLSTKSDIMTPAEHKLLFQNCEELLRLSEDILEQIVSEEGEVQLHLIASVYLTRLPSIISLYKTYCNGLKRADCVLVQKSRQQGGNFVKLCTEPPIPRRRPDVTQFVHKPLEQFRELLRLLRAARLVVPSTHPDYSALARLVNDLQNAYHDITAAAGLMGPVGEGRPLLSVADLESRLVFTRCKPFTLSKPGRQWIFGGDLARVEGRTVRPYWALLFSDLLLFATVSRDRVLFITEEPLPIANIAETCFNVRKKANEFRLAVGPGRANSPTARCGPPVRARARTIILRAPSSDLKAVWQSLLLRQILRVNSSSGTPLSSPMESPAPLGCYSEMTLDSQQRQVASALPEIITEEGTRSSRLACKGAALHLARWMKSHPGSGSIPPEPEPEIWSTEQLRKRSKELRLLDVEQLLPKAPSATQITLEKSPSEHERSPSRSTNSDSQITVRSSPVVPETVAVCRGCHKRCFSKPSSPLVTSSIKSSDTAEKLNNDNQRMQHNHVSCQKVEEEVKCCVDKCSNVAEIKSSKSPEKKTTLQAMSEIRTSIIRSRESFFKSSDSKESCSSPLNRASPKSPCSQKSDSSHSTLYSTNSPLSYAHTTCSSIAMSNSTGKKSMSPGRDSIASGSSEEVVQCVIAQEKYLNEVKCVENIVLSKGSPFRPRLREPNKIFMGKTIVERNSSASKSLNKCLASDSPKNISIGLTNGDVKNDNDWSKSSTDFSWGPLMLMGLTTMNPAAHLMQQLDSSGRQPSPRTVPRNSPPKIVPNISVVPPTPDFKNETKILLQQHTLEDSPDDSPIAEEPPYLALKRYGTMSSLERLPSDELDDNQLNALNEPQEKETETAQGLLGWTTRAGNYVAEKMALLNSLAESGAASTGASFLERYLGAGEWKTVRGVTGIENEGGEGSGASGEEAWGTPSSGDLSDHAFPDSDHATLSSPTKSSSSCPGDEDTELMMDELLMTPPITGPSLRPLLPRRRLEPLMEEEGSDASSTSSNDAASEVTPSRTDQGSGAAGGVADPRPPAPRPGPPPSPDRTPTNPHPPGLLGLASPLLLSGSPERGLDGRSTSSSTLEGCRSAPDGSEDSGSCGSGATGAECVGGEPAAGLGEGRLSPRMEMRLALLEGTDILAEHEQRWDQVSGRCGWVRRPLGLPPPRTRLPVGPQNIILNNSVSAPAGQVKVSAMERLALMEARGARRGTRRPRPTARLMGLVRRRASSDSPERRPYSPRRQQPHVSSHGYYKICFVNGFV